MEKLSGTGVKSDPGRPGFRQGLCFACLILLSLNLFSQRKSDIGFFAGTNYYMGDLNPGKYFNKPGYAIGPFYRYNFEPRNSIRVHGIYHALKADSEGYGDPWVEHFNATFNNSYIDFAALYEINFIPYKTANRKMKQSIYLTGGLGYNYSLKSPSQGHIILPFGMGYKFNLAKKLSAGVEMTCRKTFSDDAIDNQLNIAEVKNLVGNNDWYTFAGIFISYKIFNYRDDCPAYED